MEGYVEVYILFDQSKGTFNNDKFMEELFINYSSIKFVEFFPTHISTADSLFFFLSSFSSFFLSFFLLV